MRATSLGCSRNRGRRITAGTERQLWSAAAGHCENPDCVKYLFHDADNGKVVTLGELAHLVAASHSGPRSEPLADETLLASFDNLIVLCLTCHRIVDSVEEEYPVAALTRWKQNRRERIRSALGTAKHDTRADLRAELRSLLAHNHAIFLAYGPNSATADDPLTDAADVWRREASEKMVPTNRRIIELLTVNQHLLTGDEQQVVAAFRVHADAFEARHLFGELHTSAPRFPEAMNTILEPESGDE